MRKGFSASTWTLLTSISEHQSTSVVSNVFNSSRREIEDSSFKLQASRYGVCCEAAFSLAWRARLEVVGKSSQLISVSIQVMHSPMATNSTTDPDDSTDCDLIG
jgi:hypothetical protein